MSQVPSDVLQALARLSGYERMLEIDRISAQYGVTNQWLEQQIGGPPPAPVADPNTFAPASKETPSLPSATDIFNKQSFRFEYDPSAEAAERRQSVEQAIVCPACGVALGIPAIRPIKVTCPQCLQESTFQA